MFSITDIGSNVRSSIRLTVSTFRVHYWIMSKPKRKLHRDRRLAFRLSVWEGGLIEAAARMLGLTTSAWVRMVLIEKAKAVTQPKGEA